jgi:hypothetical protein
MKEMPAKPLEEFEAECIVFSMLRLLWMTHTQEISSTLESSA